MRVTMTPAELAFAWTMAAMRNAANRNVGVTDRQRGPQNPLDIDRDGFLAELAVAKFLNLYPDMTTVVRKGGADLISRQGKRIDVKATRYKQGKLIVGIEKQPEAADVYILAVVDDAHVDLIGYLSAERVMRPENVSDIGGKGQCYLVEQNALVPFKKAAPCG